jgi:hypothetical protein
MMNESEQASNDGMNRLRPILLKYGFTEDRSWCGRETFKLKSKADHEIYHLRVSFMRDWYKLDKSFFGYLNKKDNDEEIEKQVKDLILNVIEELSDETKENPIRGLKNGNYLIGREQMYLKGILESNDWVKK